MLDWRSELDSKYSETDYKQLIHTTFDNRINNFNKSSILTPATPVNRPATSLYAQYNAIRFPSETKERIEEILKNKNSYNVSEEDDYFTNKFQIESELSIQERVSLKNDDTLAGIRFLDAMLKSLVAKSREIRQSIDEHCQYLNYLNKPISSEDLGHIQEVILDNFDALREDCQQMLHELQNFQYDRIDEMIPSPVPTLMRIYPQIFTTINNVKEFFITRASKLKDDTAIFMITIDSLLNYTYSLIKFPEYPYNPLEGFNIYWKEYIEHRERYTRSMRSQEFSVYMTTRQQRITAPLFEYLQDPPEYDYRLDFSHYRFEDRELETMINFLKYEHHICAAAQTAHDSIAISTNKAAAKGIAAFMRQGLESIDHQYVQNKKTDLNRKIDVSNRRDASTKSIVTSLKEVIFFNCQLNDQDCLPISELISLATDLRSLNLACNSIGYCGIAFITSELFAASCTFSNLHTIVLDHNNINIDGISLLSQLLSSKLRNVKILSLNSNPIKDRGVYQLLTHIVNPNRRVHGKLLYCMKIIKSSLLLAKKRHNIHANTRSNLNAGKMSRRDTSTSTVYQWNENTAKVRGSILRQNNQDYYDDDNDDNQSNYYEQDYGGHNDFLDDEEEDEDDALIEEFLNSLNLHSTSVSGNMSVFNHAALSVKSKQRASMQRDSRSTHNKKKKRYPNKCYFTDYFSLTAQLLSSNALTQLKNSPGGDKSHNPSSGNRGSVVSTITINSTFTTATKSNKQILQAILTNSTNNRHINNQLTSLAWINSVEEEFDFDEIRLMQKQHRQSKPNQNVVESTALNKFNLDDNFSDYSEDHGASAYNALDFEGDIMENPEDEMVNKQSPQLPTYEEMLLLQLSKYNPNINNSSTKGNNIAAGDDHVIEAQLHQLITRQSLYAAALEKPKKPIPKLVSKLIKLRLKLVAVNMFLIFRDRGRVKLTTLSLQQCQLTALITPMLAMVVADCNSLAHLNLADNPRLFSDSNTTSNTNSGNASQSKNILSAIHLIMTAKNTATTNNSIENNNNFLTVNNSEENKLSSRRDSSYTEATALTSMTTLNQLANTIQQTLLRSNQDLDSRGNSNSSGQIAAEYIAMMLEQSASHLQSLNLSNTGLTDATLLAISKAIMLTNHPPHTSVLKEIQFSNNDFTPTGANIIANLTKFFIPDDLSVSTRPIDEVRAARIFETLFEELSDDEEYSRSSSSTNFARFIGSRAAAENNDESSVFAWNPHKQERQLQREQQMKQAWFPRPLLPNEKPFYHDTPRQTPRSKRSGGSQDRVRRRPTVLYTTTRARGNIHDLSGNNRSRVRNNSMMSFEMLEDGNSAADLDYYDQDDDLDNDNFTTYSNNLRDDEQNQSRASDEEIPREAIDML